MEKETIENIAMNAITAHRDSYKSLKNTWTELYTRYENKLREGSITSKTEGKIRLGGCFSLVENTLPRIIGRDPKYRYIGRENEDEEYAELYDEFSEYQFDESGAREELRHIARWALITGLAGWKMGWKEEKKIISKNGKEIMGIKVSNPLFISILDRFGAGKDVKIDQEEVTANYTIDTIKPHDLIWSLSATNTKKCPVFGHQDRKTIRELKDFGFDTSSLISSVKETDRWMDQLKSLDGVSSDQASSSLKKIEDDIGFEEVQIAEIYLKIPNDQGYYESWVTWIGNIEGGNLIPLKTIENPYDKKFCPMGIFRPIDREGKFYGFGVIEPSIGAIDAEEDTLNISIESLWTSSVPPMEVNPANLFDPKAVGYGPRKINYVRNLGQTMTIMPTQQPNIGGAQFILDYLNRSKQNISGITDYQTGSDQSKGQKTLGEIQIKTQESNYRVSQILSNFEKQVLEPMGKFALYFNQQYLRNNKKIFYRILGKKGKLLEKTINIKDIEAIKDIVVVSGSTALAMQQAELNKWSALLNQIYMEEKSTAPVKINKLPVWKRLFEQGLLVKDPETFIPSLKELEMQEVGDQVEQLQRAKQENAQPIQARVLSTDNPAIHIQIHQAEIVKRKNELDIAQQQGIQIPEEVMMELQMLVAHLDNHTISEGGVVPNHSANMQVGQGMGQEVPQQIV